MHGWFNCVVESNQPFLAPSLAQITQFTLFFKNLKQGYKVGFFFNLCGAIHDHITKILRFSNLPLPNLTPQKALQRPNSK